MKRGRGYLGQNVALLSQTQKSRSQKSLDTGNICEKSFEFRFNLLFYVNANGFTAVKKIKGTLYQILVINSSILK